jgi:hypothetical protein
MELQDTSKRGNSNVMSIEIIWIKKQTETHFGCISQRGYLLHWGTCKYEMEFFDRSTLLSDPER